MTFGGGDGEETMEFGILIVVVGLIVLIRCLEDCGSMPCFNRELLVKSCRLGFCLPRKIFLLFVADSSFDVVVDRKGC